MSGGTINGFCKEHSRIDERVNEHHEKLFNRGGLVDQVRQNTTFRKFLIGIFIFTVSPLWAMAIKMFFYAGK